VTFSDAPVAIEDVYSTILEIADIEIPENRDGKSLLPFLKEEPKEWREFLHGEHSGWGSGRQFMTDGKEKYIWKTGSGKEHFFDLVNDPQELVDLVDKPEVQERLNVWRDRMIAHLATRIDGMSDGEKLIPLQGEDPAMLPWAETGIFDAK
jgi:arylsulfatase A-like enzyme